MKASRPWVVRQYWNREIWSFSYFETEEEALEHQRVFLSTSPDGFWADKPVLDHETALKNEKAGLAYEVEHIEHERKLERM